MRSGRRHTDAPLNVEALQGSHCHDCAPAWRRPKHTRVKAICQCEPSMDVCYVTNVQLWTWRSGLTIWRAAHTEGAACGWYIDFWDSSLTRTAYQEEDLKGAPGTVAHLLALPLVAAGSWSAKFQEIHLHGSVHSGEPTSAHERGRMLPVGRGCSASQSLHRNST